MPQLDGLRAFAVIGVWITHWRIGELPGWRRVPWGNLGVHLFFVLSGFLISGILLRVKQNIERGEETIWFATKRFYLRRAVRILPIYYLTLLVTVPIIAQMRAPVLWHLTYTSNIYFAKRGDLNLSGSHFWTLAVEEQFYLMWPWILICTPRRYLLQVMTAVVAIGPLFRTIMCLVFHQPLAAYVLTFGCMDAFAMGGLLALFSADPHYATERRNLCRAGLILGLPLAIALPWFHPQMLENSTYCILFPLATAGVFTWVIGSAAVGFGGIVGTLLVWRPVSYLGRISYGMYIYHVFVAWVVLRGARALHHELPGSIWVQFVILAAATVAVSAASWHLVEKPFNDLKRFFTYTPQPPEAQRQLTAGAVV